MYLLQKKKIKRVLRWMIILGVSVFVVFVIFIYSINTPNLNNFNERKVAESTKIYDRTGETLLYDIHGEENRTVIDFSDIPRSVKNATIALEDDTFYTNIGVRPLSLLRSFFIDIFNRNAMQGGSTITQQLVKNTLLSSEKTIVRKLKEIVIAIKLEREYSKDEILNLYLNQIPYGSNAYGIEAAAETFFGKHARDLTLAESAYLASLPQAPTRYSPYGNHRKELDARARFALDRMRELKFITDGEYKDAINEKTEFAPAKIGGIIAPHFVMDVREAINNKFGEDVVNSGGLKVITTLDADLQQKAEESVTKFAASNEQNFNAKNEALVAIDPKSGDILAMVGSRNYFDTENDGNFNIITAHRQPGSAIKPFVYATAFKKGYTPETTVFDLLTEFNPVCGPDGAAPPNFDSQKCYHPQNFDGKFRGPVSLREALAQSLNVPSVKVLYLAGLKDSLSTIKDFGITSLNEPDRYGLTLVLGGGEVSPLELTSAYSAFANGGILNPWRYILSIEDKDGNTVFQTSNQPRIVIDSNIANSISDMLSDNKARGEEFGTALEFSGKQVAVKTGTTNDYRDAWTIGYTPDITVGTWAGNNDNTPMKKKIAGFIIAPLWHDFMDYALTKYPDTAFTSPEKFPEDKVYLRGEWRGGQEYIIDKISGKLATEYTPEDQKEKKVVQSVHSILYWINRDDPQFKNWETPVRQWAIKNGFTDQTANIIPNGYDDIHTPANMPKIISTHLSPQKDVYGQDDIISVQPQIESKYEVSQVDYFLESNQNEWFLGASKKPPFRFIVKLNTISESIDSVSIKIKIYDASGNTIENDVPIKIHQNN